MPTRTASAEWSGDLREGEGTMSLGSGAFSGPYSFRSRFEEGEGTNPEELIAAAHAGCFSMAFALALSEAGHTVDSINTRARVSIEQAEGGFAITRSALRTEARVPGIEEEEFQRLAEGAKGGCPVSKALRAIDVELEAQLAA
jgi:osmotically inducible protein OsmC